MKIRTWSVGGLMPPTRDTFHT